MKLKRLFIAIFFVISLVGCKPNFEKSNPLFDTANVEITDVKGIKSVKSVPLERRNDGAWRLKISKEEISDGSVNFIDIKIPACIAQKGEDGYFITTTSGIGTFREDNGIFMSSRNYYKFFGMKTPRATWLVIVKNLKEEFDCVVEAKKGTYQVFPRFQIKRIEFAPYDDIVADFYELTGDDATYAGMARKYRQYQLERGEVKPIKQRMAGNPKLERMTKSIMCRIAHGGKPMPKDKNGRYIIKDYTVETELPMNVQCTTQQAIDAIKALKKAGCDNVTLQDVGWNIRGHDGRYPQLFPVEPAIGGEDGLRRMIATAKACGYDISCHTNNTDAYRIADCWSEDYIAKRADGSLMYVGCWAGGKAYTPCPRACFDRFIKDDYAKIKDLGFNGFHHTDVLSAIPPRCCHDAKHKLNREEWTQGYLDIMEYGHKMTGGFTSECGFDHLIKYLDWAFYINHKNNPPKMIDRYVPIWQIVYHGIVPSEAFFSDTGCGMGRSEDVQKEIRLHHAEFGGRPVFYGGWTNLVNIAFVKKVYDEYQEVAYLQFEFMQDHKALVKDVYLTVYGDGSEVVSNYSNADFDYRGARVAGGDYKLFKSSNSK